MMNRILFSLSLALLFHFHFSTTLAQSPAASPTVLPVPSPASPVVAASPAHTGPLTPGPPAPAGHPNIMKILEKDGRFTLFLRLLKSTSVGSQINAQLKDSNNGLTVFAPTDAAFSNLKQGTLNSLTGQQQIQLLQFHILPTFLTPAQFQTATNPLRTQAGGSDPGEFPLNVTTNGNLVNMSTGVMSTTISGSVYTANRLAVYQVDNVLLPWSIFGTPVPTAAPAPAPEKAKRKAKAKAKALALAPAQAQAPLKPAEKTPPAAKSPPTSSTVDISGTVSLTTHGVVATVGVGIVASFLLRQ
ncbi:fasciclin-like arabinogalactan protein 11 [Cornus florida]|uniref:fasciclin-like arabinogalactan protein 11 n=1 Tax=Cornus florida TaxID=4283 RepID=UPI00289D9787|nr:fasciclin-like arabinogalactan protein 11 [Cornus florida]